MLRSTRVLFNAAAEVKAPITQATGGLRLGTSAPVSEEFQGESSRPKPAAGPRRAHKQRGVDGLGRRGEMAQGTNLVLKDIPRAAKPADVLRALKHIQAVHPDLPLSAVTSPPPSFPRAASLHRPFHLALPTIEASRHARQALRQSPLFHVEEFDGERNYMTSMGAPQWKNTLMDAVERNIHRVTGDNRIAFYRRWMTRQDLSGRLLVLSGLPRGMPQDVKTDFLKGFLTDRYFGLDPNASPLPGPGLRKPQLKEGEERRRGYKLPLEDGPESIYQLPSLSTGIVGVVFKTTADAHSAARAVNMTKIEMSNGTTRYLKAYVHW